MRAISNYKPQGGLYLEWRFKGGVFALRVWWALYLEGLIHGGAYFRNFTVPFFEINTPFLSCYHLLVYQISWTFQTAASPPMLDLRAGGSPCQKNYSGGSRGGARVPPLILDQTVARGAEKIFFWNPPPPPPPPPYLRVWMTEPPPYLKDWIRHWIIQNSKLKMRIKYCDKLFYYYF